MEGSFVDLGAAFDQAIINSKVMTGGKLAHIHEGYIGRELEFIQDILGKETWKKKLSMWSAQRAITKSVFKNKRTVVYSSRGQGKDFSASQIAMAWFYTRPSRILCFGPSLRQLKTVLFREISETFHGANVALAGEMLTLGLKVDASHFIAGIPAVNPDAARGQHAGVLVPGDPDANQLTEEDIEMIEKMADGDASSVLIIIDEPEGITDETFRVLEGTLSKPNVHILMIGNPCQSITDEHAYPRSLLDESGAWYKIKLSSLPEKDYPDPMGDRYDEVFDMPPEWLIPKEAKEKAVHDYDQSDPIFLSDWLGRFSTDEVEAQVVPSRVIVKSALRYLDNRARFAIGPRIGIDLGFGGADPCVATLMVNGVVCSIDEWRPAGDDPQMQITVAHQIRDLCVDWGVQVGEMFPDVWDGSPIVGGRVSIDDTGLSGVGDVLFTLGVETDRVNFGKSPDGQHHSLMGTTKVVNVRTEMFWAARMGLSDGLFHIPDEEKYRKLREELPWTRYERKHDGESPVILLEPKKEIKKRHKRSPDFADSFVLACRETSREFRITEVGARILGTPRPIRGGDEETAFSRKRRPRGKGWTRISLQ